MVGGNFAFEFAALARKEVWLNLPQTSSYWFQNGRGAIAGLIKLLKLKPGDEVLVPEYHCEEVTKPFFNRGIKCNYYRIDKNLSIRLKEIKKQVSDKTRLVVVITFMGFPQEEREEIVKWCQKNKLALLEDNVPIARDKISPRPGAFQIYSFRKHTGVVGGAVLVLPRGKKKSDYPTLEFLPAKATAEIFQLAAAMSRFLSQVIPIKILWLVTYKLHRLGEDLLDDEIRGASKLSRFLIIRAGWQKIIQKRQANSGYLTERLIKAGLKPLIKKVPPKATPLMLPVVIDNPERVKQKLRTRGLFVTQFWHLPKYLNKRLAPTADWITKHVIYLTVDQRYGEKEMELQAVTLARVKINP
ncbi:TPA: hypothetical protein DEB02_00050 [Candidatus Beckwithbacteria bacterium]|nr:hypothetical protein [Candidatus Beckwithbacteria bacterium]